MREILNKAVECKQEELVRRNEFIVCVQALGLKGSLWFKRITLEPYQNITSDQWREIEERIHAGIIASLTAKEEELVGRGVQVGFYQMECSLSASHDFVVAALPSKMRGLYDNIEHIVNSAVESVMAASAPVQGADNVIDLLSRRSDILPSPQIRGH